MEPGQEGWLELHIALLKVPEYGKIKTLRTPQDCVARIDPYESSDEWKIKEAFPANWPQLDETGLHAVAVKALAGVKSDHYKRLTPEDIVAGIKRHLESERILKRIRERQERWERGELE